MTERHKDYQTLHDTIIQSAYDTLDKVSHDIYINPGTNHLTSVNSLYPDIIITKKGDKNVKFIIEVETQDSINQNEIDQWRQYALLGGTFYLLVPKNMKETAEILCRQNNIKSRIGIYYYENSKIIIKYD
jgi:hypothetical protein